MFRPLNNEVRPVSWLVIFRPINSFTEGLKKHTWLRLLFAYCAICNFFFVKDNFIDNNKFNKEEFKLDENNPRNSISTEETLENELMSDDEIDFHQDFFPKIDTIRFTDLLVDDWKDKIQQFYERIYQNISRIKNI